MARIVLVRHGRSGHLHSGWINREEFLGWREAYESAGIHQDEVPPHDLNATAAKSGVIAASTAPRAIESARLLAPGRDIRTSPLLAELELAPPALPMRMPLTSWMIAIGVQWATRAILRRVHVSELELQRSRDAARWLADLASSHESVLAVTHGSLRLLLSNRLVEQGWRRELPRRRRNGHWSAWQFKASP